MLILTILTILSILAVVVGDQAIKIWVVKNMTLYEDRPLLKIGDLDILHLHYILNDGSAFSSFSGQRAFLLAVTILGTIALVAVMIRFRGKRPFLHWTSAAIVAGGLGNMIDRVFRSGNVIDYLDVQLFDFAIFNFADCFVTVGTILLFIYILFFLDKDEKREKQAQTVAAPTEEEAPDDKA